jgi:hypothetical protein
MFRFDFGRPLDLDWGPMTISALRCETTSRWDDHEAS